MSFSRIIMFTLNGKQLSIFTYRLFHEVDRTLVSTKSDLFSYLLHYGKITQIG